MTKYRMKLITKRLTDDDRYIWEADVELEPLDCPASECSNTPVLTLEQYKKALDRAQKDGVFDEIDKPKESLVSIDDVLKVFDEYIGHTYLHKTGQLYKLRKAIEQMKGK